MDCSEVSWSERLCGCLVLYFTLTAMSVVDDRENRHVFV